MDISEVARKTGVPASSLRYYEEKGLIQSVSRRGLKRVFDQHILERLALIALGRAAGFSLDEIRGMLGPGSSPDIDRDLLLQKADELEQRIQKLGSVRDGLLHAAACSAPSHMECPSFRRLLDLAAVGVLQADSEKLPGRSAK